jgi:hypothetical protein
MESPSDHHRELFKLYEDGKHRRYELLFAVNGGAFAVARILQKDGLPQPFGKLSFAQLCIGMAAFTLIMVIDIFCFGWKMRKQLKDVFQLPGILVLLAIGALIIVGWVRAGW